MDKLNARILQHWNNVAKMLVFLCVKHALRRSVRLIDCHTAAVSIPCLKKKSPTRPIAHIFKPFYLASVICELLEEFVVGLTLLVLSKGRGEDVAVQSALNEQRLASMLDPHELTNTTIGSFICSNV